MAFMPMFDVQTQYSISDSIIQPSDLRGKGYVGVSDTNTLAWDSLQRTKGVIPIFGIRENNYIYYAIDQSGLMKLFDFRKVKDDMEGLMPVCLNVDSFNSAYETQMIAVRRAHFADDMHARKAVALSKEKSLPMLAINSPRMVKKSDYQIQRIYSCNNRVSAVIMNSMDDQNHISVDQYWKSAREMKQLFKEIPSAIDNAYELAEMCSAKLQYMPPEAPFFKEAKQDIELLRKEITLGMSFKKGFSWNDRVKYEFDVISDMGFAGYFLITADFVNWSKRQGIRVGAGRGSGAGSVVAYLMGITDVDPIKYKLLFERFLNPDRIAMPDFDIDFDPARREEVIGYVRKKYGPSNTAVIATVGTHADSNSVNLCSRVHGYGISGSGHISRMRQLGIKPDNLMAEVISDAEQMIGFRSDISRHASGVVIDNNPVSEKCPVFMSKGLFTGADMNAVETMGLVKFDFLGLKTLQQIAIAEKLCGDKAPKDEITKKEKQLYASGNLLGVFQVESRQLSEMISTVKPKTIEQVSDCIALYRPGPMQSGMLDRYVKAVVSGKPEPSIFPKKCDKILKPTQNQLIYQEQVIQIVRKLAKFTLAEADLLRRAMGKKKQKDMDEVKKKFLKGCKRKDAKDIFDNIDKFAGYGFNKSHSVSYATITHETAWLKAHYPKEFYCATMQVNVSNSDKLMYLVDEARRVFGISFAPIDVNEVGDCNSFRIIDGKIHFALQAIKNLSETAAINFMSGKEWPKRAIEGLDNVGPNSDSVRERQSLGFNLRYSPCKRGQYMIHDYDHIMTKKGVNMVKLVVVNDRNFIFDYMIYGDDKVKECLSYIEKGAIIKRISARDGKWIESISI